MRSARVISPRFRAGTSSESSSERLLDDRTARMTNELFDELAKSRQNRGIVLLHLGTVGTAVVGTVGIPVLVHSVHLSCFTPVALSDDMHALFLTISLLVECCNSMGVAQAAVIAGRCSHLGGVECWLLRQMPGEEVPRRMIWTC